MEGRSSCELLGRLSHGVAITAEVHISARAVWGPVALPVGFCISTFRLGLIINVLLTSYFIHSSTFFLCGFSFLFSVFSWVVETVPVHEVRFNLCD